MNPDYISLLIQVPILGAFIWFTLRLSSDFRADTKTRDVQWQAFIAQQNDLWRSFIKDMLDTSNRAEDMTAHRLQELAAIISVLRDDLRPRLSESRYEGEKGKSITMTTQFPSKAK